MDNQQFDIQKQFEAYLERVKLADKAMPNHQYTELRRAFFGAWSQMLVLMQGPLPDLPENEGVKALDNMLLQCEQFWIDEMK